jgi:phosphoserine phosphatase
MTPTFALFDLDHTLLSGDSDVLWCDWLMRQGLLERASFEPRNAAMEAGYKAGTVSVHEFSGFYVGTLAGRTPAPNRVITELTAAHLGIEHLIATECELGPDGAYTGRVLGQPNMREGKVVRLREWLGARGLALEALDSVAYSDSMNDAPLLQAARRAVAVDPDARLAALAAERGWAVLRWR